ncbi:MAG TPA: Na+/H+ antiporter NhaA [Puia sp.]|nr:Na+/H+ antiporter NhaA [Puia sp.]
MINRRGFRLTTLFTEFFNSEKAGGIILLCCTLFSIWMANGQWGDRYTHFWHMHVNLSFSVIQLDYSLEEWINDGLMTIFFLMVGLEIERELYAGELSNKKNVLMPVAAAIGGMLVPGLIHFGFNHGTITQPGIGIPMATDIAFSLGILSLLGNRVPPALKVFLAALAIIDDLGSVILIAIFYTKGFSLAYLSGSLALFLLLLILRKTKVYALWIYLVLGICMWYCMLKSGVHPTVSGVLLAFAIPFTKHADSPSRRLQQALHFPVNNLIIPVFALANTGIHLADEWYRRLESGHELGIMTGLVLGKPLGIFIACWLAVKLNMSALPEAVSWKILLGTGMLAGIGFTMSIFISNVAFPGNRELIEDSKMAVLMGSLLAAVAGLFALRLATRRK